LSFAVQMDPIETINPVGDSTFALMLEAEARGHKVDYYTPDTLSLRDNRLFASVAPVSVFDREKGQHFELGQFRQVELQDFDVVLMRQDPPFDMNYITSRTCWSASIPDPGGQSARRGAQRAGEDPRHRVSRPDAADADHARPGEIGAFRRSTATSSSSRSTAMAAPASSLQEGDHNLASLLELFEQNFREPFMVQRYLPEVRKGDKRIILVDGEPVAGHQPRPGRRRGALQHACRRPPELSELTEREREICAAIGPRSRSAA
jgi:glutathione synthase